MIMTTKLIKLKKEAWIQNLMKILHYTREEAEKAYDRVNQSK